MSAVSFEYYTNEYQGKEATQATFPALNAQAERMIGAMARWRVDDSTLEELPSLVRTLYRLAVCSQIDYISINGIDSITGGGDNGFTVGKVSIHGSSGTKTGGAMSANISPAAVTYLEQTGLMNPAVPVAGGW